MKQSVNMSLPNEVLHSILFIDIENCPSKISELLVEFQEYHKIVICYANISVKIPLDWLIELSTFVMQGRLELVKMNDIAKNSADFGITFMLGCYCAQYDRFEIYSNDKDFDVIINLVNQLPDKTAKRVGTNHRNKELQFDALLIKMCKILHKIEDYARPIKLESLQNTIRSQLTHPEITERSRENLVNHVINQMELLNIVDVQSQCNTVRYNSNYMQEFLCKMHA